MTFCFSGSSFSTWSPIWPGELVKRNSLRVLWWSSLLTLSSGRKLSLFGALPNGSFFETSWTSSSKVWSIRVWSWGYKADLHRWNLAAPHPNERKEGKTKTDWRKVKAGDLWRFSSTCPVAPSYDEINCWSHPKGHLPREHQDQATKLGRASGGRAHSIPARLPGVSTSQCSGQTSSPFTSASKSRSPFAGSKWAIQTGPRHQLQEGQVSPGRLFYLDCQGPNWWRHSRCWSPRGLGSSWWSTSFGGWSCPSASGTRRRGRAKKKEGKTQESRSGTNPVWKTPRSSTTGRSSSRWSGGRKKRCKDRSSSNLCSNPIQTPAWCAKGHCWHLLETQGWWIPCGPTALRSRRWIHLWCAGWMGSGPEHSQNHHSRWQPTDKWASWSFGSSGQVCHSPYPSWKRSWHWKMAISSQVPQRETSSSSDWKGWFIASVSCSSSHSKEALESSRIGAHPRTCQVHWPKLVAPWPLDWKTKWWASTYSSRDEMRQRASSASRLDWNWRCTSPNGWKEENPRKDRSECRSTLPRSEEGGWRRWGRWGWGEEEKGERSHLKWDGEADGRWGLRGSNSLWSSRCFARTSGRERKAWAPPDQDCQPEWRPKASRSSELESMFGTKQALACIDPAEAKRLIHEEGAECLPSKMVYTLKPSDTCPQGKMKARLVVCGNYSEEETPQDELFASGATAVALRLALAIAAQMGWKGRATDIKTAFLNAPLIPDQEEMSCRDQPTPKRALVKPPAILIQAGLVKPEEMWEALKAVYGYRKSPRLWGNHCDKTLLKMIIDYLEGFLALRPLVSEPNLWRVLYQQEGQPDILMGLMIVYVDDLLILSNDQVGDLLVNHIRSHWELSPPERIHAESGTPFLGTEL